MYMSASTLRSLTLASMMSSSSAEFKTEGFHPGPSPNTYQMFTHGNEVINY